MSYEGFFPGDRADMDGPQASNSYELRAIGVARISLMPEWNIDFARYRRMKLY